MEYISLFLLLLISIALTSESPQSEPHSPASCLLVWLPLLVEGLKWSLCLSVFHVRSAIAAVQRRAGGGAVLPGHHPDRRLRHLLRAVSSFHASACHRSRLMLRAYVCRWRILQRRGQASGGAKQLTIPGSSSHRYRAVRLVSPLCVGDLQARTTTARAAATAVV